MRRLPSRLLLLGLALLAGCAELQKVGRQAARATPQGRKYLSQFDYYASIAKKLKKFHDSKTLDESVILDVLVVVGVVPPPKGAPPSKTPAPKPFPVPAYKGKWAWPLEAGVVSSEFGPRWGKKHNGIDIAADRGVPIMASAPGEVVYSGNQLTGYGNVVFVRHDQDTVTLYAHNDSNGVKVGDKVSQGQRIAKLGSTGHSTGPHIHFEMRVKSKAVNPRTLLPKSRF
ncbi:MAG TPA: hypothetical protein DCM05_02180 [Elusimicrobia bacterium]|nr:hypothetical protein [Elusimicrobiota bacterium]